MAGFRKGRYMSKLIYRCMTFAGLIILLMCGKEAQAKKNIQYTIKKGKSVSIGSIYDGKVSSLKWVSKNRKIARITADGKKIKAVKKGTAHIYGKKKKKKKVHIKIRVGIPSKKIVIKQSDVTVIMGQSTKLDYTVYPKKTSNKKVNYEYSDDGIITISSSGYITPLKPGTVNVKMYSSDGHSKASFKVTVITELIRDTVYGKIEGIKLNDSCVAWYGVPYAKPPVGELRWRAPKDPDSWNGVLSTNVKKDKAAQAETKTTYAGSEDCLYLNIFRPNSSETNLPVMVYLHGGSNISGSAHKNFRRLASDANCIVVAVEYRLGAFGWFNTDALKTGDPLEDSGNFAMLDIRKALMWVRNNIAYFGGNNGNVTLSGFSAGARNVLCCIISPVMKGLFDKAICFSGGMTVCSCEDGQKTAEEKIKELLVKKGICTDEKKADIWYENAYSAEIKNFLYSLTTAEAACIYTGMSLDLSKVPQLFADGYVIPKEGFEVIKSGNYNMVPMMFGSVTNEFASYALSAEYINSDTKLNVIDTGWEMLEMIKAAKKYGSMYMSYNCIEKNAETFAAAGAAVPIYTYRFDWGNNASVTSDFYANFLGSIHGTDVDFLCETYDDTASYEGYVTAAYNDNNKPGRQKLSDTMQACISGFLKYGNPNAGTGIIWNPWNQGQSHMSMIFNANASSDKSYATYEGYSAGGIEALMRAELDNNRYNIIMNNVLKGRYFMLQTAK